MKEKLLLLHGALGTKDQFIPLKKRLEPYYEVHDLTFEGHGGIPTNNEFSIDLFTQNVIDFLGAKNIKHISIFGYSMGGYVALNTALKLPNKIKKVITLGTKFDWTVESSAKEIKMLNPEIIELKVPSFASKLEQDHHPNDWKTVLVKTGNMMLNMGKGARLTEMDFKNIQQAVTVGVGSLDKMVSYEESAHIVSLIPNSTIVKLDGIKHQIDKIKVDDLLKFIIAH